MSNRTVRLRVDGWSNDRFGRVEGNLVMFEVMSLGCACSTCLERLTTVMSRMSEHDVKWTVAETQIPQRREMGPSVLLVVEPEEIPEKVDTFLAELLGLQVSEVPLSEVA